VLPTPMVVHPSTSARENGKNHETTKQFGSRDAADERAAAQILGRSGSTTAVRERAAVRFLSRQRHWSKCGAQDHGGVAFANAPLADSHRSPRVAIRSAHLGSYT